MERELEKTIKRGKAIDILTFSVILIVFIYMLFGIITDVKIRNNILKEVKENCITLNGEYYCKKGE